MKDMQDIRERLRLELGQWFVKQCQNNYEDYYLYYIESKPDQNGGFIICANDPPNERYKLAWNQPINKGATIEQNYNFFIDRVMRRLPILDDNTLSHDENKVLKSKEKS